MCVCVCVCAYIYIYNIYIYIHNKNIYCRNFGKELVMLFHRTAAAPWGHVASIIKRSSTRDSLSLFWFHSHNC